MESLKVPILSGISSTLDNAAKIIREARLKKGFSVQFILDSNSVSLSDLYGQIRILSCLLHLRDCGYQVILQIDQKRRQKGDRLSGLETSGFLHCLKEEGVQIESNVPLVSPEQLEMFSEVQQESEVYTHTILPLQRFDFETEGVLGEEEALERTHGILNRISSVSGSHLEKLSIPSSTVSFEFGRILWGILKEFILNTIVHSGSKKIFLGIRILRETGQDVRSHKPGLIARPGQHLWDISLLDTGLGIFPTADATLRNGQAVNWLGSPYFRFDPWNSLSGNILMDMTGRKNFGDSEALRQRELIFLKSIFQGNLGIRKGRRSEGLHEISKQLHWFNGSLNLRSGRSGIIVSSTYKGNDIHLEIEQQGKLYSYLPGVIASVSLPSIQLATDAVRLKKKNLTSPQDIFAGQINPEDREVEFVKLEKMPSWLFGSQEDIPSRRMGEMLARRFVSEYYSNCIRPEERVTGQELFDPSTKKTNTRKFLEIDLRHSRVVRSEFLDVVLQEICKESTDPPNKATSIISKIIFTNVRRDLINELASGIANSFILLKHLYCVFLDEADQPHFLGIPRLSKRVNDLEDVLNLLLENRALCEIDIAERFYFDANQIEYLKILVGESPENIFFSRKVNGITWFYANNILETLRNERVERLWDFTSAVRREPDGVIRLINGHYVDKVIDFPSYWTHQEKLVDAAKVLLLEKMKVGPVHCVIGFMNIGDRLAGILQRFLVASDLCILDPKIWCTLFENSPEEFNNLIESSSPDSASSILVVDAVYPGDDQGGYLYNFLKSIEDRENPPVINAVVALADFRPVSRAIDGKKNILDKYPLFSIFNVREGIIQSSSGKIFEAPQEVKPTCETTIRTLSGDGTIFEISCDNERENIQDGHEKGYDPLTQYSEIELSSEFWHNSSIMKLISPEPTGREKRNMLFYENNEQIIEHYRTRTHLESYLSDFVRKKIKMKVDVILHPTHSVGSFLSHLVSSKLNHSPLILPLSQSEYGGEIRVTPEQFKRFQVKISSFSKDLHRITPRALIVDDSVLTGSSLFTMIGIAHKLGLEVTGVFVVLNKLTPFVSAAISTMKFDFSYLYRLHMPLVSEKENPDIILRKNSKILQMNTSSFLVRYWSEHIFSKKSYLRQDENFEKEGDRLVDIIFSLDGFKTNILKRYELIQVIHGLLLHPNETILDFNTKIAITYNFIEALCREQIFWEFLNALVEHSFNEGKPSISIKFARQIILLTAYTRHGGTSIVRKNLFGLCIKIQSHLLEGDKWQQFEQPLCDSFLIMSFLGNPNLFSLAEALITKMGPHILENIEAESTSINKAAWRILSAYAWSIEFLVKIKKVGSPAGCLENLPPDLTAEQKMLYFELFSCLLLSNKGLREKLGIKNYRSREDALKLVENEHKLESPLPVMNYLSEAPGYACTLGIVIEACDAWGVFVFAKRKEEIEYQLRTCASKNNPAGAWNISPTFENKLEGWIKKRMEKNSNIDNRLFFTSEDEVDLRPFKFYRSEANWIMGVTLIPNNNMEDYYVVLVYDRKPIPTEFPLTDYYYWHRIARILQDILPEIHEKHAVSARASSAIKVAMDAMNHSDYYLWSLSPKKRVATLAVILLKSIEMPNHRSDISLQTPVQIKQIKNILNSIVEKYRIQVGRAANMLLTNDDEITLPPDEKKWIEVHDRRVLEERISNRYISFNGMVFQFVFLESLRNALVNFKINCNTEDSASDDSYLIDDRINIYWDVDFSEQSASVIHLWIENPCESDCNGSSHTRGKGVAACEDAVKVIGGHFDAIPSADKKSWVSHFSLPVHVLPETLQIKLKNYLAELT